MISLFLNYKKVERYIVIDQDNVRRISFNFDKLKLRIENMPKRNMSISVEKT